MIESAYHDARAFETTEGPICYVRRGAGPPLVLLHGVPLSLVTWRHNLAALAQDADVIALDLKGFGRSHKQPGDYSPQAHAATVLELLDGLRLPRVSLVGSSYGCAVALTLARLFPERVERLALINSVGYPGGPHSLERLLRIGLLGTMAGAALGREGLGRQIFRARLRASYCDPQQASPELVGGYFELLRRDGGARTFLATLRQFDEAALAATLPQITQETLILWGAHDHVLPVSHAERFSRAIRRSQLHILPGCGHLPHEEAPRQVNDLLGAFIHAPSMDPALKE